MKASVKKEVTIVTLK